MKIGVDIGGTNMRAGIELGGAILHQHKTQLTNKDSLPQTLQQLFDLIRPLVQYPVEGIGIGVPSVVDVQKGIVYNAVNIPSWEEVALRDILETEFKLPVSINNDVNCFILGEHRFGLAQKFSSAIGVTIGTGLGTGIIINNQLYEGNNCGAGEIGMLPYRDSDMEGYVSNRFFEQHYQIDAFQAYELAIEKDAQALQAWEEYGKHLATVIKAIMYTYDPEAIILGGSIAKASGFFQKSMLENLMDFAYPESLKRLTILNSHDENIALLGASALLNF